MEDYGFSFKDIVENAQDVILVTKAQPITPPGPEIVYVNQAFTELTGFSPQEVIGLNPRILQSTGTDAGAKRTIYEGLRKQIPVRVTLKNYSKSGKEYWLDLSILPLRNPRGVVTHYVAIERDVTAQIDLQHQLEKLSSTDSLTGLLNRRAFDDIAENELSRYQRSGDTYALLLLDIDHFKQINDQYGHASGDGAIQAIAQICESNLRLTDKIARIGGEEFCVLLPDTDKAGALAIAQKLRNIVSCTSVATNAGDITMTISIGVAVANNADTVHADLMKRADQNLYAAKQSGRNRVCW